MVRPDWVYETWKRLVMDSLIKLPAEVNHDREVAREAGARIETQPDPDAPWKNALKKLREVLDAEPETPKFQPRP